jgi:hypothetical protein
VGKDAYGNTVPITPTWSVTGGIGTVNSSGLFTAETAGAGTVVATSGSISGSANVTVISGSAASIAIVSGDGQSGTVGTALAPFVVIAKDANGNPVGGVSVTFAITSGNGSLSATSTTTGSDGKASTTLTLGTTAGANKVTATSTGLSGSPVTFNATGIAGPASSIALFSGDGQSGTVGTALSSPFVVIVKDVNNNPVSGVSVAFAVTVGGGSLSVTNTTTGSDGKASSTLTLGASAGTNTVTATSAGLSGSPVTFNATGVAGQVSATNSTVVASPTSVGADGVSTSTVTVTLKDANNNPVSGHSVTISSGAYSTTISPSSGTTGASGQVSFTVKSTQEGIATITATDTTPVPSVVIINTASITFNDVTPPANVANLVATPGDTVVNLTWTASTSSDVMGYKVYTKAGAGSYDSGVNVGNVTSYQKASLTNGTSYTFKVAAYDEVPNESAGVEVGPVTPTDITPPGNITGFTVAQGSANGQITGSWTNPSNSDFAGVRFRYRTDGVFPTNATSDGTLLGDKTGSPGAADNTTWSSLNPEATYYITGFAYDNASAANYASGTNANMGMKPKDLTAPANAVNFTATPGNTQVSLSWANPSDSDFAGMRIVRKVGGAPASTTDGTVVYSSTGTSYTDTSLTNGTTYYYAAYSYDEVPNYSSGVQVSAISGGIAWTNCGTPAPGNGCAQMPTDRTGLAVGVVNDKIYVIGGLNSSGKLTTVEEYNPTTNTWTNCGTPAPGNGCIPMPTGRYYLAVGVVGSKIYAIGGYDGSSYLAKVEEYDPATNTWTNCGTPAPGNGCTTMPTARSLLAAGVVGSKVYAIGGTPGTLATVEEYDPATNTWTNCGTPAPGNGCTPMPTTRYGLAVGVVGSKIYAIGGSGSYSNKVEEYDPATNTWTNCGNGCTLMTTGREGLAAGVVNNKIYAIGGYSSGPLTTVEEYNPATNTWTTKTSMPTGRYYLAAGIVNNKIYAIGGYNGSSYFVTVEEGTMGP